MLSQADHVRAFSLGTCAHFNNFEWESPSENISPRDVLFVVVTSFSWFSSKDSHAFPLKRNEFSSYLWKLLLFPKDYHTFSKLSLVCIKVAAANFITSSLFATELLTFSKINQGNTKVNFINVDNLYQTWQTLSNLKSLSIMINFIKLDKLYQTWKSLSSLINFIKLDKLCQTW